MSDDGKFELSRRNALIGLGTVGAASAGAGIGTSAYFSDDETFEGNTLTAGELDLKIDWEEHYYNGMGEQNSEVTMAEDPASADYFLPAIDVPEDAGFIGELGTTPISASDARPIALNFTNSQDDFWDATAIEAYPDTGVNGVANDGSQDSIPDNETACEYLADVGGDVAGDLDPSNVRSDNADTRLDDGSAASLINLQDVKPGDFGEITFSFHLCDNPGYVWLQGDSIKAAENGYTEPELEDKDEITHDEDDPEDRDLFAQEGTFNDNGNLDEQEPVELLDNILTRMWYDDGNNQVDRISGKVDVMCAIDTSGSLDTTEQQQNLEDGVNEFINALANSNADVNLGTVEFGDGDVRNKNDLTVLDEPGDLDIAISSFGGNTPMPGAMDIADQALYADSKARTGAQKVLVLFSDGGPNYENTSYTEDYTAPRNDSTDWSADSGNSTYDEEKTGNISKGQPGGGQVTVGEMDETAGVAESIRESTGGGETTIATVFVGGAQRDSMSDDAISAYTNLPSYMETEIASDPGKALEVPDTGDLKSLAQDIVGLVSTTEDVFFLGTLRQALQLLSDGHGAPLAGDLSAENGVGTGRNCFSAENTHYIGFEWWLPINHGNQIQGDSVSFDIGFYTEQCRHNDGSGQPADS